MSGRDSEDLEALFERIVAERELTATAVPAIVVPPAEVLPATAVASVTEAATVAVPRCNSAELTAAADLAAPSLEREAAFDAGVPTDVFQRVGVLTRSLHDALRELGYDKGIESAMRSLPDARDRLDYIASLTGQAAERTLGAVERAREHQDTVAAGVQRLRAAWEEVFAGRVTPEAFRGVAGDTRAFLDELGAKSAATSGELTEIMMAQDFHDLTGQVIARIVNIARDIEKQLVALLVEVTPPERRPASEEDWLTGPAMRGAERSDVVTSQAQVDELLESLGF